MVNVVVLIRLRVHLKLVHVTTESRRAIAASCVPSKDSPLTSKAMLFGARAPSAMVGGAASQASGNGNGDAAALRVEPRRGGGRRRDCPDLKSGSAAHEICDSMESLDMVALVHFVI